MNQPIRGDLCILGAGSVGLSIAAGAAQMGARVVLIEADKMSGDCLDAGCVPSKSLLASAKIAKVLQVARAAGAAAGPSFYFRGVHDRVHVVIGTIAPHDSVERFTSLGCTVVQARGRFVDAATVEAGGQRIKARRFVVATGSRAAIPDIPGLASVRFLSLVTLSGGVLFGVPMGVTLSVSAATLGSATFFVIARTAFGDALRENAGRLLITGLAVLSLLPVAAKIWRARTE